jgi:hypothetical protein
LILTGDVVMKKEALLLVLIALLIGGAGYGEEPKEQYIYVAPNAVQAREFNIFTTITLTNTTDYWFNPRVYLIDPDGDIIWQLSPLLKSYGTWQKASTDIVPEDFRGSIWVVSPQPIVSSAFIHQMNGTGLLSLLGTAKLERIGGARVEALLNP